MGDPFLCGGCDRWFNDHDALERHSCPAWPKDRSAFGTMQHQLKEALLEISRHHADFKKVSQALDDYEGHGDPKLLYKTIRTVVG